MTSISPTPVFYIAIYEPVSGPQDGAVEGCVNWKMDLIMKEVECATLSLNDSFWNIGRHTKALDAQQHCILTCKISLSGMFEWPHLASRSENRKLCMCTALTYQRHIHTQTFQLTKKYPFFTSWTWITYGLFDC